MTALRNALSTFEPVVTEARTVPDYSTWVAAIAPVSSTVLVRVDELTDRAREILSRIKSFSRLRENWDSYGAQQLSNVAIQNAFAFVAMADRLRLPLFFTAPGPDGEILVELQSSNKSIEITFEPDGTAFYAKFIGVDCVEEGTLEDQALD
ncbi:MAG: hypothetical protein C4326_14580 [Ignavibacteria bacterium]